MMYDVQTMARTHLLKLRSDARSSGILATVLHITLDILVAVLLLAYASPRTDDNIFALRFDHLHVLITVVWFLVGHLIVFIVILACARHGTAVGLVYYIIRLLIVTVVMIAWPYKLIWLRYHEFVANKNDIAADKASAEMSNGIHTKDVTVDTSSMNMTTTNGTETAAVIISSVSIGEYTVGLFIGVMCALVALVVLQAMTAWLFGYLSRGLYKEYYRAIPHGARGGRQGNDTSLHWHQTTMASSQIDNDDEGKETRHTLYPRA